MLGLGLVRKYKQAWGGGGGKNGGRSWAQGLGRVEEVLGRPAANHASRMASGVGGGRSYFSATCFSLNFYLIIKGVCRKCPLCLSSNEPN